jgi:hypothetical protein
MPRLAPLSCAAVLASLSPGCDELDEFHTAPGEVFHGQVIGGEMDGGVSFVRSGFEPRTEMELTFDPERASALDSRGDLRSPGEIHTYECPPDTDQCAQSEREPGHFDRAPLEPIAELAHDALSQYDFPGGGRLRNYMFGARFRTPGEASAPLRDAMVFISLMENGRIEARVIAQSALDASGSQVDPPLFGVFALERRER